MCCVCVCVCLRNVLHDKNYIFCSIFLLFNSKLFSLSLFPPSKKCFFFVSLDSIQQAKGETAWRSRQRSVSPSTIERDNLFFHLCRKAKRGRSRRVKRGKKERRRRLSNRKAIFFVKSRRAEEWSEREAYGDERGETLSYDDRQQFRLFQ